MKAAVSTGRFLFIAGSFFLLWYIIYEQIVLPDGRLDYALSVSTAGSVSRLLNATGFEAYAVERIAGLSGNNGVEVVARCNGVAVYGIYLAFIIAVPGTLKNRISFIVLGAVLIYLTNFIRITVLVLAQEYNSSVFHFVHDYLTTAVFYLVIILLWAAWLKLHDQYLHISHPEAGGR